MRNPQIAISRAKKSRKKTPTTIKHPYTLPKSSDRAAEQAAIEESVGVNGRWRDGAAAAYNDEQLVGDKFVLEPMLSSHLGADLLR